MIIAIAGAKGGVGKTTLAVHLAGWFHTYEYSTILIDGDLSQLSSRWLSSAMEAIPYLRLIEPKQLVEQLPQAAEKYDVVIVDCPGGMHEATGAILSVADAVLLPTGPSGLDVDGLDWTIENVQEIRKARSASGTDIAAVIVPVKATEGRVSTKLLYELAPTFGFGITPTTIPYATIYEKAAGLKEKVPKRLLWQMGRNHLVRKASLKMDAIFQGIFPEACEHDVGRIARMVASKRDKGKIDIVKPKRKKQQGKNKKLDGSRKRKVA